MKQKRNAARLIVFSFLIFALTTGFSYAQRLTGTIRGTVTDEQGLPLPGVTVELSSPVLLGGIQSQITGENGIYRFANLPPGTYKIVFSLEGFQRIERLGIEVVVKGTVTEDIILKQAALAEDVTVIGEAPVIDVTSSGTSTNYGKDLLEKMPLGRASYLDVVKQAPGVIAQSAYVGTMWLASFGSNNESNAFQIDGLDASSSAFGFSTLVPNQDTFSEVEVSGVGNPAEYGNFSGVVVNVVTKSGGNVFSGALSYYGQFQALNDDNNPDPDKYFSRQIHRFYDTALTFGGPVLKDRLWFFGSANLTENDVTGWRVDPQYHAGTKVNNYMFKLSSQIVKNHKLVGAFSYRYYDQPGVPNPWATREYARGYHEGIPSWNVMYTWILSKNAFFELKSAGYSYRRTGLSYQGEAGLSNPVHYDYLTGVSSGGVLYPYWVDYSRFQANASISYFADNFLGGDHDFKMGVQYNKGKDIWAGGYSGGKYYMDYGGEPYYLYTWPSSHYGGENDTLGVFFDDSWRLGDRLSINLGLRFDRQNAGIPRMPIMENWQDTSEIYQGMKGLIVWNLLSPRIGFAYTLTSDKKTVLKGHYGRYYDNLFTGTYEGYGPLATDWTAYYWDGSEWAMYDFVSGERLWVAPRNLKSPFANSFSMSLERELFPDFSVGILGMYREWRNQISIKNITGIYEVVPMVSPDNGQTYMVYNQLNVGGSSFELQNYPDHRQNYKGITLMLNKRYSNNWLLTSSLTWSRSYGKNAISSTNNSLQMNVINMSVYNQGKDPNDWINAEGLMNMDRTWVFKLQFGYNLPWDILFSLNYQAMTGRAYVESVRVYPDQGMRTIKAAPRSNKLRFDPQHMLDLRVQKSFTVHRNIRFSVLADVFNALNLGTVTGFANYGVWALSFREPSGMAAPRYIQVGLKLEF
ncbi:MAG TPA: hypothetical protein DIW61_10270 [Candidatus Aminicenantes bacterium]|nr:hypothetical protein [Candidatus Aminicenantes bacterium]